MSGISDWLHRIGLGQYADAFDANGIDVELLKKLTNEDLKDIGVARLADRKRILEESERLPSARADLSGNRRLLTVLFCDLVGSTELSTKVDPEELRAILRRYQETALASISKHSGVIANYIGDGVMAYFGWPHADEDQARQAVRAGFDLIAAVGAITSDAVSTLRARVGIASGRVVVGGDTQLDSAFGETLNLAARLQSAADENCVVIERTTRHMIGPAFGTKPMGAIELKGFPHPVEVWQATEEHKHLDRFASHHEGASQFVGRKDELRWLALGWRDLDQGRGRTAVVRGEAGIGKSRLLREFERSVRQENCTVIHFQCSPNHVNSAFYPVIQQIEASAGFESQGEAPAAKFEKLARLFSDAVTEDPRLPYLLSDLLSIPDADTRSIAALTAAQRRQFVIKALVGNVARMSRQSPVLVILEDAHWIDPSSLEMLQELSKRADEERIFVLITTRPGRELHLAGTTTELGLGRLSDTDVATLARSIAGSTGLNEQELASIVRRVEGVPLFAEELASTLVDRKVDAHLDLPENIQASVTARLDALGDARQVAQIASVVGREFSYAQLAALVSGAVSDLEKSLDQLLRSGLLLARDPLDRLYAFKHALVRDVAYESLLHEPRRQLHLRFANVVLSNDDKERIPELAAHHLTEAGDTTGALAFWKKAGYRASRASAYAEAIAHFSKGLALIAAMKDGDGKDRSELEFQVGITGPLIASKGYTSEELRPHISRALELGRRVVDAPEIFPVLYGRWSFLLTAGFIEEAFQIAQEFSNLAERQGNRDALYARHRMLGGSCMCLGALDDAQKDLEQAVALYVPTEHEPLMMAYGVDIRVAACCFLGEVFWLKGRSKHAKESVERALEHARSIGHLHSIVMSLFFNGLLSMLRRDRMTARSSVEEMLELGSRQPIGSWPLLGNSLLGWAEVAEGRTEQGLGRMNEGMEAARKIGVSIFIPIFKCCVADILLANGRGYEASNVLDDATTVIERSGDRNFEAELWRLRAELHILSGPVELAEKEFETALDIARRQNAKTLELRAAIGYARFLAARGQVSRARGLLQDATSCPEFDTENADFVSGEALLKALP